MESESDDDAEKVNAVACDVERRSSRLVRSTVQSKQREDVEAHTTVMANTQRSYVLAMVPVEIIDEAKCLAWDGCTKSNILGMPETSRENPAESGEDGKRCLDSIAQESAQSSQETCGVMTTVITALMPRRTQAAATTQKASTAGRRAQGANVQAVCTRQRIRKWSAPRWHQRR